MAKINWLINKHPDGSGAARPHRTRVIHPLGHSCGAVTIVHAGGRRRGLAMVSDEARTSVETSPASGILSGSTMADCRDPGPLPRRLSPLADNVVNHVYEGARAVGELDTFAGGPRQSVEEFLLNDTFGPVMEGASVLSGRAGPGVPSRGRTSLPGSDREPRRSGRTRIGTVAARRPESGTSRGDFPRE